MRDNLEMVAPLLSCYLNGTSRAVVWYVLFTSVDETLGQFLLFLSFCLFVCLITDC